MGQTYHILNGDALKAQLLQVIQGTQIVMRECLVDGCVEGENLDEFFKVRAKFIAQDYEGYTEADYHHKTAPELQKLFQIPQNAEIVFWFEDDLFCQVNFWFAFHHIKKSNSNSSLFLVRPPKHTQYGFCGLGEAELVNVYQQRIALKEQLAELASLWKYYQLGELQALREVAISVERNYPFILPAVQAHLDRIPSANSLGRPTETLIQIKRELNTNDFGEIFREFCKRESIYGFGDLQMKQLLDGL